MFKAWRDGFIFERALEMDHQHKMVMIDQIIVRGLNPNQPLNHVTICSALKTSLYPQHQQHGVWCCITKFSTGAPNGSLRERIGWGTSSRNLGTLKAGSHGNLTKCSGSVCRPPVPCENTSASYGWTKQWRLQYRISLYYCHDDESKRMTLGRVVFKSYTELQCSLQ